MKYFFISLFFIFLTATDTIYAQTKKQVESVSYICPEDTNVFSSYTAADARKSSREENKNVLYVFTETIDDYFTEQKKNNHLFEGYTDSHPGMAAGDVATSIQSGTFPLGAMYLMSWYSDPVPFLLNGKKTGCSAFIVYTESDKLWDYPRYKLIFISSEKVFTFDFLYSASPEKLGKELPSYVLYEENGGMGAGWYWTDKKAPERLYRDIIMHHSGLPESVLNFQKDWEMILTSIRIEK